jgi:hypothetical protein
MRLFSLFPFAGVVGLIASLISAAPTTRSENLLSSRSAVPNATLIYGNGGWIECIRVRWTGDILLPYTNVPELWSLNPFTGNATLLFNFTGHPFTGFTGITEVQPDFFAIFSGNFSITAGGLGFGSWGVWTFDFRDRGTLPPIATFVRQVPESQFFLGASRFDDNNILFSDGGQGLLYKMNLQTGAYNIVSQDPSMNKNGGLAGIHGVNYLPPYIYYSNTFGGGYWRLLVSPTGVAIGLPTEVSPLSPGDRLEEFAAWIDNSTYIGIQAGGIKKVAWNGTVTPFVNVEPPTTCTFGRTLSDWDVLYIATKFGTVYKAPHLIL